MDDRELEEVLRGGLAVHAEDADTAAAVVERARADVGRRRRTRWTAVAAAAAVAVIAGGTAVARMGNEPLDTMELDRDRDPGVADGEWRTEYWADVAVDVPADWGYGGAPDKSGLACFPEAMVGPGGRRVDGGSGLGYVGRPVGGTDVCAMVPKTWEPAAPYVWLGAGIEPGTFEYDNGYVQETVEVNGATVTVGTPDAALRERILSTARGGETCTANLAGIPRPRFVLTEEGLGELLRAEVCAYGRPGTGDFWLTYAQQLSSEDVETTFAAAARAPDAAVDCDYQPYEFVVVRAYYDDPMGSAELERSVVVETGCEGSVAIAGGPPRRLTPAVLEPWARNGIRAVVHGPSSAPWVYDYFIGPQG